MVTRFHCCLLRLLNKRRIPPTPSFFHLDRFSRSASDFEFPLPCRRWKSREIALSLALPGPLIRCLNSRPVRSDQFLYVIVYRLLIRPVIRLAQGCALARSSDLTFREAISFSVFPPLFSTATFYCVLHHLEDPF